VKSIKDVAQWARDWADELESKIAFQRSGSSRGEWMPKTPEAETRITVQTATAIEFLRQYADGSIWLQRAEEAYKYSKSAIAAKDISEILREWSQQAEEGIIPIPALAAMEARVVASIDIMDQVRALNADRHVHPAAPIVLAGGALETALRAGIEEKGLPLTEKPSISAYARLLYKNNVLGKQDLKDVEQLAGMRNDAAHGDFDALSRERAGLMEQQVNFFLARLQTLLGD
jgi:hypothetical protein